MIKQLFPLFSAIIVALFVGTLFVSGRSKRGQRYTTFGIFASLAQDWFPKFGAQDTRHNFFKDIYSFYVVVGGRDGAVDKRIVDVFYGQRPIDQVTEISYHLPNGSTLPFPRPQRKFVGESGPSLRYQRTDRGTVFCFLEPARSEGFRRQEDSIILAYITEPRVLTGEPILKSHWRALLSYCECSSADGDPQMSDHIRVAWLIFTRPLIVEGKVQERRIVTTAKWILKWVVTVGMSGFLLALIMALQHKSACQ